MFGVAFSSYRGRQHPAPVLGAGHHAIPTDGNKGCAGTSALETHACQPSASRLMVTVFGVPPSGRCSRRGRRPFLERLGTPPSSVTPLPYARNVKLWWRLAP